MARSAEGARTNRTGRSLRIATRGSPLALWQTRHVAALLARHAGVEVEEVVVQTTGDIKRDVPIHAIGGQGVFVREVQTAVLEGRADLAVHSAKDLPPREAEGLCLAAVPARGDVRDALVGHRLDDLPAGACVATGSVRRRAQLAWRRPDLTFVGLRGNIGTRIEKVGGEIDAVVVATAALDRLGLMERAAEVLPVSVMLPQVAQGALAVECAAGRDDVLETLRAIEDSATRAHVDAERAFLDRIGGGCDLPVGALATSAGSELTIEVMLAGPDGRVLIRRTKSGSGADPAGLGRSAAEELLAAGGSVLVGP